MTAKEKAEELVNKFSFFADTLHNGNKENAKQCALISVDEIVQSHYVVMVGVTKSIEDYWNEVKQEIEKL
jgi:hypothetical protein